jgi:hypothetical protein
MNTISNAAQKTDAWLIQRLGCITGSECGKLMKSSRKKDEVFGETARSYIYKKAAELDLLDEVKTDSGLWEMYKRHYSISSKAIEFGIEQEVNARELYIKKTGRKMIEVGLCRHPTIPNFASSPDGFYYNENNGDKGCLEIKVPNIDTYYKYRSEIRNSEDLFTVNPDYYYQCLSHIACCKAQWVDFVCYQPFLKHPIHIVRILPDEKVFSEMESRIKMANEMIGQITDN